MARIINPFSGASTQIFSRPRKLPARRFDARPHDASTTCTARTKRPHHQKFTRTGTNLRAPPAIHTHGEEIIRTAGNLTRTGTNYTAPPSKLARTGTENTRGCQNSPAPAHPNRALSEKTRAPAACTRSSDGICNPPPKIYAWDSDCIHISASFSAHRRSRLHAKASDCMQPRRARTCLDLRPQTRPLRYAIRVSRKPLSEHRPRI